ncbi:MAG: stage sporulation protein, partial [Acidobacteriota bacterium]|nr:stage sporulation protein [Acidobacteriota bacterium]
MNKSKVKSYKSKVEGGGLPSLLTSAFLLLASAKRQLPSSAKRLALLLLPSRERAHACVCAFVLLAWALPGVWVTRTDDAPPVARMSDDEADESLRRAAQSALGGREGAVVVLDAQTGRVRALAGGRTAFEEATPPGSAVKPFTMLAALRSGALDEDTRLFCRGSYKHEDFKINCSHPRYRAAFGPVQALANSCNYFFAHVAESLDGETYARTLREFGFGAQTRGGDEREAAGLLPHSAPRVPEMLGESDELRVTPAQLVTAYAALFNGGRLLAPQVARAEGFTPRVRARTEIADAHRALLLAGMRGAVAYGTAARAGLSTLPVYVFGKTGTSTPQDGWRAQGWFVGFAAGRTPAGGKSSTEGRTSAGVEDLAPESVRLAVLVFLKRSRGAEAAELARPVFEAYARTLDRQEDDSQRAGSSASGDAAEASPSNSLEARSSNSDGVAADSNNSPVVRVRLSRDDLTLALPLEDYVFGVLAAEGSVETEPEALKALAVVARSYALKNLRRHARDHFDLCDTTHCQRFAPVHDEGARTEFYELAHRAVRETAGEVLRDAEGRVAESYFSAACGGRTADIAKLWGVRNAPSYLRGVHDDSCDAANETWTDVIPAARLLKALRADERSDVGARLDGVRVVRRDQTGRAESVALDGARRRVLRGWDFKIIVGRTLGWSVLKSSRFEVSRAGAAFIFRGTGFGHGLGLCQAGAHVSAARGASYRQILRQYFPGTGVGRTTQPRAADSERVRTPDSTQLRSADTRQLQSAGSRQLHSADTWQLRGTNSRQERVIASSAKSSRDSSSAVGEVMSAVFQPASRQTATFKPTSQRTAIFQPASVGTATFQQAVYNPQLVVEGDAAANRNPHPSVVAGNLHPSVAGLQSVVFSLQSAGRARLASEHFRVSYPARVGRREVEALLRTLEAAYADVSRRLERASLGATVPDTEVFVYETTGDFAGATGQPAWVAAVTVG